MENNNKNNEIQDGKKAFLIRKNNDINDLLKVKDHFEDPNIYLTKDKKMIIGNLHFNNKKSLKNKLKIKSFSLSESNNNNKENKEIKSKNSFISKSKSYTQGQMATPERKKTKIIQNSLSRPKTSTFSKQNNYNINSNLNTYLNNLRNNNEQNSEFIGIHYQRKSLSEVLNILKNSKIREEKNKSKGVNNFFPKNTQKEIRQNFYEQEKILKNKIKFKNKSDLFSQYLSKKIKRKEEELLFNKLEEYRLKKQVIEYIENSKSIRDKFGDNYWIADLRRPKMQNEIRVNYFNNGNKNKMPEKIVEYADKEIEFIHDPSHLKKNKYTNLLKNLSINNLILSNKGIKFPDMEKMNEIEVIKGKNLVEQEYLAIMDGKSNKNYDNKKYKLYKDPLEQKYKNIKELVCGENYDKNFKGYKNRSCRINRIINNKKNNLDNTKNKKNKKNGLFRSQSLVEENKNSKYKNNYLKEAIEILKAVNNKKSIKILSSS